MASTAVPALPSDPLRERWILLTGAGGGIGQAIARQLAQAGARLILVGRSPQKLAQTIASLSGGAERHRLLPADISTGTGQAQIQNVLRQLGRPLDVLINCAGVSDFGLFAQISPEQLAQLVAVNLTAPMQLCRLALDHLHPGRGRIINVGSTFGGIGHPGFVGYCASKFGLRGFTQALRRELSDGQLQVAYLAPRATRTALNTASVDALNEALGNRSDAPERVAAVVESMLRSPRMRDQAIGWPERLFLRVNAVLPSLVDGALRKQLGVIRAHASGTSPAAAVTAVPSTQVREKQA
ncbi:MAG: SDR family oxidoreductase [Lysobacterales bacterium]